MTSREQVGIRNSEFGARTDPPVASEVRVPTSDFRSPTLSDASTLWQTFDAFSPTPSVRTLDWAVDHVVTDAGRPYDHAAYPHLGAPGGPMDAFDDPRVREIALQFATRLGKTFFGQVCQLKTAATDPAPMMFASSTGKLALEVVGRTYKMLRARPELAALLRKRHESQQKASLVEFHDCELFVAWSRAVSTLADKNVKVGHANEIDKWVYPSTAKEAHPLDLFTDRSKDFQSVRKLIFEGTPTIRGHSPIERRRLAGTNCRFQVPCPHCRKYQWLEFGGAESRHGVKWDTADDGRTDPDVAEKTARYVCRHCQAEIHDHHRTWMMRRGVWCPEGCAVNDAVALDVTERSIEQGFPAWEWNGWKNAAWIEGAPARDGTAASYHLSTLYALAVGWGDCAKVFVEARKSPPRLRNVINQWWAETWEIVERKQTWEQLGERWIVPVRRGLVPEGFSLVTVGLDRQQDFFVYVVQAWKPGGACHRIAYGQVETHAEILELLQTDWPHVDEGPPLRCRMALADCGYRPKDVYDLVDAARNKSIPLKPCRGPNAPLDAVYRIKRNGKDSSHPGRRVVWVDVAQTEAWIDAQLHTLTPDDPNGGSLYQDSLGAHEDYLTQLLNGAAFADLDNRGRPKEIWKKVDEDLANDYRDDERYGYVAMLLATRGRIPQRVSQVRPPQAPASNRDGFVRRPQRDRFVRRPSQ